MRVAISVDQFRRALNSLLGKPLSAAGITRGDQSCLSLDFGRMTCVRDRTEKEPLEGEGDQNGPPIRIFAGGVNSVESGHEPYKGELTL